ncbi:MAG: hypothetical protein KAQ98_10885 [Bacteriovoracaceae bacterium]|nr:hypothetical protein [Bacteriovoracaceae bacterium]
MKNFILIILFIIILFVVLFLFFSKRQYQYNDVSVFMENIFVSEKVEDSDTSGHFHKKAEEKLKNSELEDILKKKFGKKLVESVEFQKIFAPPGFDLYNLLDDLSPAIIDMAGVISKKLSECLLTDICGQKDSGHRLFDKNNTELHKLLVNSLEFLVIASREGVANVEDFLSDSELFELAGMKNNDVQLASIELLLAMDNGTGNSFNKILECLSQMNGTTKADVFMMLANNPLVKDAGMRDLLVNRIKVSFQRDDPYTIYSLLKRFLGMLSPRGLFYPSNPEIKSFAREVCRIKNDKTSWNMIRHEFVMIGEGRGMTGLLDSICASE